MAEAVARFGPLGYDEVLDLALYSPELGFYESGRGAGRDRADFLTSPEVGPLFAAVLARALDAWWLALDRPDPFVVIEAGAGRGTLAAGILAATPECAPALRYLTVERSSALRRRQASVLPLEPATQVLGILDPARAEDADEERRPMLRLGPLVAALEDLPVGPFHGVVLANELLDNLPFRLVERVAEFHRWSEMKVTSDHSDPLVFREILVPVEARIAAEADRLAPEARPGDRIPLQEQAVAWLRRALACLSAGRVVVIDYADTTSSMAGRPWPEWLRTYRGQGRGRGPLADLGRQDVTCEVAVDQLEAVRAPVANRSQAEFLAAHGLDHLVEAARAVWAARASTGDLPALRARSRSGEAAALTDASGLGAFRVLEWSVPDPTP